MVCLKDLFARLCQLELKDEDEHIYSVVRTLVLINRLHQAAEAALEEELNSYRRNWPMTRTHCTLYRSRRERKSFRTTT